MSKDEQSFVASYVMESVNGKTPDPTVVATHATNDLTVDQAEKMSKQWMNDPQILTAIEQYKTITMKFDANNQK